MNVLITDFLPSLNHDCQSMAPLFHPQPRAHRQSLTKALHAWQRVCQASGNCGRFFVQHPTELQTVMRVRAVAATSEAQVRACVLACVGVWGAQTIMRFNHGPRTLTMSAIIFFRQ